jgi:hypothetical protein
VTVFASDDFPLDELLLLLLELQELLVLLLQELE